MRSPCSLFVCLVAFVFFDPAGAEEMETKPAVVTSTIEGVYEIRRNGTRIGEEKFAERIMSDNTVVFDVVYTFKPDAGLEVSGSSRLIFQEDSHFPIRYDSKRATEHQGRRDVTEASAQLFANVLILTRAENKPARTQNHVLPTGCLVIEGNIASHLRVLFERYDANSGGKQTFAGFDPLAGRQTELVLDFAGVEDYPGGEGGVGSGQVSRFRFAADTQPPIDVAVDKKGRVVWINVPLQDMEFVLTSLTRTKS